MLAEYNSGENLDSHARQLVERGVPFQGPCDCHCSAVSDIAVRQPAAQRRSGIRAPRVSFDCNPSNLTNVHEGFDRSVAVQDPRDRSCPNVPHAVVAQAIPAESCKPGSTRAYRCTSNAPQRPDRGVHAERFLNGKHSGISESVCAQAAAEEAIGWQLFSIAGGL